MKVLAPSPPYLMLHMKRFTQNQFFKEKNPAIVSAPLKGLEIETTVGGGTNSASKTTKTEKYDLIASIVHEGQSIENGKFKV